MISLGNFKISKIEAELNDNILLVRYYTPAAPIGSVATEVRITPDVLQHTDFIKMLGYLIKQTVLAAVSHELDHQLTINGELLTEPHPEGHLVGRSTLNGVIVSADTFARTYTTDTGYLGHIRDLPGECGTVSLDFFIGK